MNKEEKIENIKNVGEFYLALRNEVANRFNSYERCGIFDGWTENQKKECFGFGTYILSKVWLPIQKHYTNKERKKYEKIVNKYEDICKRQKQQITDLQSQLAITEKALELACERVKYFEEMQDREMGHFEFFGYDNEYDLQAIIEQYKQQALTHQHEDKGE